MESLLQYDSSPEQFDQGIEDTDKIVVYFLMNTNS